MGKGSRQHRSVTSGKGLALRIGRVPSSECFLEAENGQCVDFVSKYFVERRVIVSAFFFSFRVVTDAQTLV